jgi:hypothetical protein
MDKKDPTEASPSCREVSQIAASSRFDNRPGNKGFDFVFLRIASGISPAVHLCLECRRTGEGERIRIASGDNGKVGDLVSEGGLV